MNSKFFISPNSKNDQSKSRRSYWQLVFISVIFIALMSSFFFGNHKGQRQPVIKTAYGAGLTQMLDPYQHGKS